jgi:hypothetical protein
MTAEEEEEAGSPDSLPTTATAKTAKLEVVPFSYLLVHLFLQRVDLLVLALQLGRGLRHGLLKFRQLPWAGAVVWCVRACM